VEAFESFVALALEADTLRPCEPLQASPELQRRFDQGRGFEASTVDHLEQVSAEVVVAAAETEEELEVSTADAMEGRVPVIVSGRLPTDRVGKRVGKPDFLVIADDGGYRPVDVKHHMALEPADADRRGLPGLCSSLAEPRLEDATVDDQFWAKKREDDLLQLAHYQRMLETAGLAAADGRWGGIVGTEQRIVWYDLDAPIWKTPSSTGKQKMRTTMARYDFEFDFRLDVIAVAHAHLRDSSIDLLVVPVAIDECPQCPWRDYCRERLDSGYGDVSLLPRIGWRQRQIHGAHGVHDRAGLASLDIRTARLVSDGVNVAEMQSLIEDLPPNTSVKDLAGSPSGTLGVCGSPSCRRDPHTTARIAARWPRLLASEASGCALLVTAQREASGAFVGSTSHRSRRRGRGYNRPAMRTSTPAALDGAGAKDRRE
jgi:hypothetical protein